MKFDTSSLDAQHKLAHESLGTLDLDEYFNVDFYFYSYDYFLDNNFYLYDYFLDNYFCSYDYFLDNYFDKDFHFTHMTSFLTTAC